MSKTKHEIRDAIHSFVYFDNREKKIIDSLPFQRLRDIHQLGLAHFVYPGARHTRFEHSLGVMHLAERIYLTITDDANLRREAREQFSDELKDSRSRGYWRDAVRLAALCHDIGHLPFSHTAEKVVLKDGEDHETISKKIVEHETISKHIKTAPSVEPDHVIKLALGPDKTKKKFGIELNEWESLLSEIIVGDAFGADRIDYLLRDSYHLGVPYGHFDHIRLIDSLRILRIPAADKGSSSSASKTFQLGVENGALRTVESLLLARYHMHNQVYFHPVVKAYELHLIDFMKEMYSEIDLSNPEIFLGHSDSSVYSKLFSAGANSNDPGHEHANRILKRKHFRQLYTRNKKDDKKNLNAFELFEKAVVEEFSTTKVRPLNILPKDQIFKFLVEDNEYNVSYVNEVSNIDDEIPKPSFQCIYVDPDILVDAKEWLKKNKDEILASSIDEAPSEMKEAKSE